MQFHENFISYHNESRFTEDKDFESDYLDESPQTDSDSLESRYNLGDASSINQFFLNTNTNFMEEFPTSQYTNYNKSQPFTIVRGKPLENEDIQVKVEYDDRLSTKTKRIQKREKARQRAMVKQDSSNIFSQNYSKYIPEGFDDPDLDDKTKKKMIQMIRNRISAQNSRDRKKHYVNTLEYARQKLVEDHSQMREDRNKALEDYKKLKEAYNQLLMENAELKKHNFVCNNCGQDNSTDANSENTKSPLTEDYQVPSSPSYFPNSYSRFASYSLTFAAIISCILITHITNQTSPLVSNDLKPFRNLANGNGLVKTEDMDPCFVKMESDLNDLESSMMKHIRPLKEEFDQNHLALYKENVEDSFPMCQSADQPAVKIEEDERGVVDYKGSSLDFLQEKPNKNLPVLDMRSNWARDGSTLFMHNGVQLIDEEDKRNVFDEEQNKAGVEKSEFLQLFVPKNSLKRFNLWDLKNRYQQVIQNENGDDNSIVELWCKVFLVRELSSNF